MDNCVGFENRREKSLHRFESCILRSCSVVGSLPIVFMTNNQIYVGAAVTFKRRKNGKIVWFLVKEHASGSWEFPKVVARKGESSVRAVLRMLGEQAGMGCRVLEEMGRVNGYTAVNGRSVARRVLYYLVVHKSQGESLGFADSFWLDYSKAVKKLSFKKEREILKTARDYQKVWQKDSKKEK